MNSIEDTINELIEEIIRLRDQNTALRARIETLDANLFIEGTLSGRMDRSVGGYRPGSEPG